MKIIDVLIDELTDKSISLTDIFVKAKVLAFKLKNNELQSWIESELNGYKTGELPDYRILTCQTVGTISNGYQRVSNFPIPILGLDKDIRNLLETVKLNESISTLEQIIRSEGSKVAINIPPEFYSFLSSTYDDNFVVEHARREIDKIHFVQTITAIRTKMLDFLLRLNEEIGENEDISKVTEEEVKKRIDSMFHSSVFGNNTTIIVGNNNTQTVTNIARGSFNDLQEFFVEKGLGKADIFDLKSIIDNDNLNENKKEFGEKVKQWISRMLMKTMDGTWQISLGAAGNILADGISSYYGWK